MLLLIERKNKNSSLVRNSRRGTDIVEEVARFILLRSKLLFFFFSHFENFGQLDSISEISNFMNVDGFEGKKS